MEILIAHVSEFSLWNAPEWLGRRLGEEFPQHRVWQIERWAELRERIGGAEVLVGSSLTAEQFGAAKRLRWIHSPAAAVHQLLFPELVESEVLLTNAATVHGPVVAEHALALIMALAKGLHRAMRFQARRYWAKHEMWEDEGARPRELAGATVVVVGMGQIGSHVARSAKALGMRVVGVRARPERGGDADEVVGTGELGRVIGEADFVVLAAPVTKSSERLLSAEMLGRMKKSACVVNVSRGDLVDEEALVEALREGRIRGAGLDVFEVEPLPENSALRELENVLITPHSAGYSDRMWERHYELIRDNLTRFEAGRPLIGLVEKRRGY